MALQNHHSGLEVVPPDTKQFASPQITATQPYQPYYQPETPVRRPEKTVCGVRRPTFWLSFALLFVIIASGIGSGVGWRLAYQDIKNSGCSRQNSGSSSGSSSDPDTIYITTTRTRTMTSAPTATSASVITVPTDGYLALDCPSIDGTSMQAFGETFRITCGQDSAGPDIIPIVAYSLLDCARACAAYNTNLGAKGCLGATFNSYLRYVEAHDGTCWLKNQTGSPVVNGLPGIDPDTYAQVILQQ